MIRFIKKNWLYFAIFFIVLALMVVLCIVNNIDIIYLIQNPSPEFITAVCIMLIAIIWLIIVVITNNRAKL